MTPRDRQEPPLGTLRLERGVANPVGAQDTNLYLLVGDATAAPIETIQPADGVRVPPAAKWSDRPFQLVLLHINDLHGHLSQVTGAAAGETEAVFSRLVWRVRDLRRRCQGNPRQAVLFLAGGDDLVGSILGELWGKDPESYVVHAGYHLYSAAGVDAAVVGNHDLDMGSQLLAQAIAREARFPLLSANLRASPPLAQHVCPAALLIINGLRVGIIGLTTPAEVKCSEGSDFCVTHPVQAVHNLLPALTPLCDVRIILSHLGRSLACTSAVTRDAGDMELAASLPAGSVHLIVGGHSHEALNESELSASNVVNGIPIVQAGSMGRFLGEVTIGVDENISVNQVHLTASDGLPVDEAFEQTYVQPLKAQAWAIMKEPLGPVVNDVDLVSEAIEHWGSGESALANFITDALVERCKMAGYDVDMAAVDASAICCGLPVGGTLTFGDWFQVMPFADTIHIYRLTEGQLVEIIVDNALRIDRPDSSDLERGFLHFSRQVRYTVVRGPRRSAAEVEDAMVDGCPLAEQGERMFFLAATSFVRQSATAWQRDAREQCGWPVLETLGPVYADTDLRVRTELVAYIREHGGVTAEAGAHRDGRLRVQ